MSVGDFILVLLGLKGAKLRLAISHVPGSIREIYWFGLFHDSLMRQADRGGTRLVWWFVRSRSWGRRHKYIWDQTKMGHQKPKSVLAPLHFI